MILFGDDISKEIDQEAKALANQLGNKLSNSRRGSPSPSYSVTEPTRGHDNRAPVPRSFSSFFRRQRLLSTPTGSQNGCHTDESQSKLITPHQVSYREQIDKLVNNQPRFVRAQLKFHVKQWQDITSDPLF